jgi:hypothetical protein
MPKLPIVKPFDVRKAFYLRAIMAWPDDIHMQEEFLGQIHKDMEGFIDKEHPENIDSVCVVEFLKIWRDPIGGRSALASMKGRSEIWDDYKKRSFQGSLCGMILTIAYQVFYFNNRPKLVSWNKIVDLIDEASNPDTFGWDVSISRAAIVNAWKIFEKVAHLWSAKLYFDVLGENAPVAVGDDVQEYFKYFFAYSRTFQEFGINFKADRSPKYLLNRDEIILVDDGDFGEVELGKIPESWIRLMEGYAAPIKYGRDKKAKY